MIGKFKKFTFTFIQIDNTLSEVNINRVILKHNIAALKINVPRLKTNTISYFNSFELNLLLWEQRAKLSHCDLRNPEK